MLIKESLINQLAAAPALLHAQALQRENLRAHVEQFNHYLALAFDHGVNIEKLITARTLFIDNVLCRLWSHHQLDIDHHMALVAIGGYGRGELHPLSDIDILILTNNLSEPQIQSRLSNFIALLWDIKLPVSQSVRTVDQSITAGLADLAIATSLFESRLLIGNHKLYASLQRQLSGDHFWKSSDFFIAKVNEQQQRHQRYHSTG